jgi:glycosyltransferase involved in cell wall biosynthesis
MLSLRARARVEYLGVRPYAEVQDYVRQAAVCVFPSYAEAMPLSWLEAMACVKPVVAYDIGWASEVVAHERTGLLVPLGDVEKLSAAIVRLLCDGALRNHFGAAGRRQVEAKFSAQAVAKQSVAWYRNVINEQNHG